MSQFLMPSLGADMESAVLMEWLVKEGDYVKKGQVIAEVETYKGVIEIEVFEDGVVEKLLVEPESDCKVGTPLAIISNDNTKESKLVEKEEVKEELAPQKEYIKASPIVRKKAKELGLNLEEIALSVDGVIHLKDIEAFIKPKEEIKEVKPSKDDKAEKIKKMRHAIALAMSRSNAQIPHYYLSTSINMTLALNWLEELNKKRSIEERVLPVAMLIKAIVKVLKEIPELNGFWIEDEHQISKEINPAIAIALRKQGLITPALLNAGEMDLSQTMASLSDLISRARGSKLKSSELSEQTITITNLGDLGVESVYGVIYPPQVAIIGLGKIMDKPWAEDDKLMVRKVMVATIAGDHRATDGRTGALFLDKLNQILQNPKELI